MTKIYVDSLFLLNFIMSCLLLRLTATFGAKTTRSRRIILGGFFGGIFSLYIFLPVDILWIHISVRLLFGVMSVLLTFGFGGIKRFIRLLGLFLGFTLLFGGFFLALAEILPRGLRYLNNGVLYVEFSPLIFLGFALLCYLAIKLFKVLSGQKEPSGCASVKVKIGAKEECCKVLLDNGHTLRDMFSDLPVIVLSVCCPSPLLSEAERLAVIEKDYIRLAEAGFRLIPCKTVSSSDLLAVRRADLAVLHYPGKKPIVFKACVGFTGQKLSEHFSGIVSPHIIDEV